MFIACLLELAIPIVVPNSRLQPAPAVWTIRVDAVTKQAFVGTSSFGGGARCPPTAAQVSNIVVVDLATGKVVDTIPVQISAANPVRQLRHYFGTRSRSFLSSTPTMCAVWRTILC